MYRSFRMVPPDPRPEALSRPRLLRSLAARWSHRVTSVTGGPGLGKTTLLAQAIAENRLAPRGEDLWIGLEAADAEADRLARAVLSALTDDADADLPAGGLRPTPVPAPTTVADAVWRRAPTEACLILDDVHQLPPGSPGAAWLSDLVGALPDNGHVVLSGREAPPVPLGRIGSQGEVLRLAEEDLRFSDTELSGFAAQRGLDRHRFDATGGWPAMVELAASVDRQFTGEYLWEEVLEPLGTMRRHILAVLCDLGGADDDLAAAAVGTRVDLEAALASVPLVARGADGWHRPHALWAAAPGVSLDPTERFAIRRRAAARLAQRDRFDEAFRLLEQAGLWDSTPSVLRSACLASERLRSHELDRWLSVCPESVRTSPAGSLAVGIRTAFTDASDAMAPLRQAAARCHQAGDLDAQLVAIVHLAQLAWWRQDFGLFAELAASMNQLVATGHPKAAAMSTIGRAVMADVVGDDEAVIRRLARLGPDAFDSTLEILTGFLNGMSHINLGDTETALASAERLGRKHRSSPSRYIIDTLRCAGWWTEGRVDQVIDDLPRIMAASLDSGVAHNIYLGWSFTSIAYSLVGDTAAARRCLDGALAKAPPRRHDAPSVLTAVATACLELAEGDEAQATATLREAMANHGLDRGLERHAWRFTLALSYVLLPQSRDHWEQVAVGGFQQTATELAALLVELRNGGGTEQLRTLELPDVGTIRAALHHRLAAELAVGLVAAGRSEGRALLDALGPQGRAAVREMASGRNGGPAKMLLAAVPAPPPQASYLTVLGPLTLRRGGRQGDEVIDPALRRTRVLALLAYLIGHRRTTRAAVATALWPDLDDRSAANNLAVTLTHLTRLLEPWRAPGEPAYLVRMDGQVLQLVTNGHLLLDVDDFDRHQDGATRAEVEGVPSVALDHHLAATQIYQGELFLDTPEADWYLLDREHYRVRFVTSATRAGQLLLARSEGSRAEALARRALDVDPWSESAYAILVGSALARGDRSGAQRLLQRCRTVLADLGAEPSEPTCQLQRRVQSAV